jgi:hypothetical protein
MKLLQVARLTTLDEATRWCNFARLTKMVTGAAARQLTGDDNDGSFMSDCSSD